MAKNTYAAEIGALWRGANEARQSRRDDEFRKATLAEQVRSNKEMENIALEKLAQSEQNIRVQGGQTRQNIGATGYQARENIKSQGEVDIANIGATGEYKSRHILEEEGGRSRLSKQNYQQNRGLKYLDLNLLSQRDTHQHNLLKERLRLGNKYRRNELKLGGIIKGGHLDQTGGWNLKAIQQTGSQNRITQGDKYTLEGIHQDKLWDHKDDAVDKEYALKGTLDKTQNKNKLDYAKDLTRFGEESVQVDEVTRNMLIKSGGMPKEWDGKVPRSMLGKLNQGAFGLMGYQSMYDKELARSKAKIETAAPMTEPAVFDQLDDPWFTDEGEVMGSIQASVDSFYNAGPGGVTGAEKLKRDPSGEWSKSKMTDLKNIYQGLNNPTLKGSGWFEISDNSQNVGRKRDSVIQLMKMNWKAQNWSDDRIAKEISSMDKQYYDGKKYHNVNETKESSVGKGALNILQNNKQNDKSLDRRINTINNKIATYKAKGDTTSSQYRYHVGQLNKLLSRQGK